MHNSKGLPFISSVSRQINSDTVLVGEQLYPANDVHVTCNTLSRQMIGQVQKIHWYIICFGLLKMSLKVCNTYQNKCPIIMAVP
jgi:hypothetical protein